MRTTTLSSFYFHYFSEKKESVTFQNTVIKSFFHLKMSLFTYTGLQSLGSPERLLGGSLRFRFDVDELFTVDDHPPIVSHFSKKVSVMAFFM